jgi:hypothetical protein
MFNLKNEILNSLTRKEAICLLEQDIEDPVLIKTCIDMLGEWDLQKFAVAGKYASFLCHSKHSSNRQQLCCKSKLNDEIYEILSYDRVDWVRSQLAGNIYCPSHILKRLSDDDEYKVLTHVADNNNTPIETLEKLSKNCHSFVRELADANIERRNNV